MALRLDFNLGNGVTVSYHKISQVISNYLTKVTAVQIISYTDKTVRDTDLEFNKFIVTRNYGFQGIPNTSDARVWAYSQAKDTTDFSNAKDF